MVDHGVLLSTRGAVLASADGAELQARTADEVVGFARRAEALGLDGVWVGDSVLAKPRHEPLTTLAAVAGATESVTLGTAVSLPALRDPVHVAHATATLDLLSGGRFVFGVGTGSTIPAVRDEYAALGVPWDARGDVLDETLDVVAGLWTGEPVTYAGEHLSYEDASLGFAPDGPPPIYVGSQVHPERGVRRAIRRRVVAHGAGWLPVHATPDAIELGRSQLVDDLVAAGREPTLDVVYYQDVCLADDEAEALAAARRFVRAYYPGTDPSDDAIRRGAAIGTPERVRDHLERYAAAGVDGFVTRFVAPDQVDQLERFAALVA